MEVSETNSILNMVMANRTPAPVLSVDSSIGEDFAALLAQPRFASENKESGLPEADLASKTPKAERQEKKSVENKAGGARAERSARPEKTVERKKNETPCDDRKIVRNDNSSAAAGAKTVNECEKNDVKTVEIPETARKEASVPAQNGETFQSDDVVVQGEGQVVETKMTDYEISLEALAQLGNILYLNPLSGEWVQTTGAELAVQLAVADETQPVMLLTALPTDVQSDGNINVLPLDENNQMMTPSDLVEKGIIPEGFAPVEDGESFNAALQNAVRPEAEKPAASETAEQPDVLVKTVETAAPADKVIVDDREIELKVSVNEEKTAVRSSSDLLADAAVVDSAVREVKAAEADQGIKDEAVKAADPEPAVSVDPSAVHVDSRTAAGDVSLWGTAAVNLRTVSEAAAKIAASPAVEVNSAHASQAVISGGEFIAAAKIDAANEDTKTTFKDIYKGMSREVVDQVKVNITKSAVKGIDKIDVHLKPEDLGSIEIKMQLSKDGRLQAHIISSRPETMEILQKEIQSLEKAFNDAGFQTDESSLSFSFRDDGSAPQERGQNNALRNFIGDVLSHEADNDLAADMYSLESWNGKTGLNIRV